MKTILFDVDGTLTDLNGRQDFLHKANPDWSKFNDEMDRYLPHIPIVELYKTLYESGKYEMIIISARQERFRKVTQTWLFWHNIPVQKSNLSALDAFLYKTVING